MIEYSVESKDSKSRFGSSGIHLQNDFRRVTGRLIVRQSLARRAALPILAMLSFALQELDQSIDHEVLAGKIPFLKDTVSPPISRI